MEPLEQKLPKLEQKFEQRLDEKMRESKPALFSREELIALCAAHIFAESFASKLGGRGTDSMWNANRGSGIHS
jgi:hypothetical protein